MEILNYELFVLGSKQITVASVILVLGILLVTWLLSVALRRSMDRVGSRSAPANRPAYYAIGRIGHYVIVVLGAIIALQSAGIDLSTLAVAAGAIGIGIGLGLQQAVNNFVSGLILLFERSLKVGDFVELENGLQGTVREINVRSTVLTTNDNLDVVVPNSTFTNNVLTNWTMRETNRRIHVPFGVAYGSNKETVRTAALDAAQRVFRNNDLSAVREPQLWLVGFGDSALNFELIVWVGQEFINRPGNTRAQFLWEIETCLRKYEVEIPFPQLDLHLRSGWQSLQPPKNP